MVKRKAVGLFGLLLFSTAASSAPACSDPTEFEPSFCSFKMPAISTIKITKDAVKSSVEDDPSVDCSKFILTDKLVREYFSKAKFVSPKAPYHDLDWSACYASGTMTLKDGRELEWTIMQVNVAYLFEKGRPEKRFVCSACTGEPFVFK